MPLPTKPKLHNGFKVKEGVEVRKLVERIFFTEVYLLSDGEYLYLFTHIKPEEVLDRGEKYNIITIHSDGQKYLGVIIAEHSHQKITVIIDDLTVLRGFDCVAGMRELKALLISEVIQPLINPEKFK